MSQDRRCLTICLGSSCFTRGNGENLPRIQHYLATHGLEAHVHLKGVRCEGRCQQGPNLRLDEELIQEVQPAQLEETLRRVL
jgi:NADH:ubiquinone oxidoreductase subunit E